MLICSNAQSDLVSVASDPEANIIMENHEFGMPPAHYAEWPILNATYNILSTTRDRRAYCAFMARLLQMPVCLLLSTVMLFSSLPPACLANQHHPDTSDRGAQGLHRELDARYWAPAVPG